MILKVIVIPYFFTGLTYLDWDDEGGGFPLNWDWIIILLLFVAQPNGNNSNLVLLG